MVNTQHDLELLMERFALNKGRAFLLIQECTKYATDDDPPQLLPIGQDMARAAMVLLHASFEVVLRGLAKYKKRTPPETVGSQKKLREVLQRIGVGFSDHEHYLPSVREMMQRRHQIVHRADLDESGKPKEITGEDATRFCHWFMDTDFFASEIVLGAMPPGEGTSAREAFANRLKVGNEWKEGHPVLRNT